MKNLKKLLSLLTVLSMVAIMFSVIPVQVSAAAGDVFTINSVPDSWKFFTNQTNATNNKKSTYIVRESGSQFKLIGSRSDGLSYTGVMLANSLSTEVLKANTTYRISMTVSAYYALNNLQVVFDTAHDDLWKRTNSSTSFSGSELSSHVVSSTGNGSTERLVANLTFDVTTTAGLETGTYNYHFVVGVTPNNDTPVGNPNLRFYGVTITELMDVNVVRSDTGASVGTVTSAARLEPTIFSRRSGSIASVTFSRKDRSSAQRARSACASGTWGHSSKCTLSLPG